MKLGKGSKFGSLIAGLLLVSLAMAFTPAVSAQSNNPANPGNSGGYDSYQNSYTRFGTQAFSTGSISFLPTCFYWNSAVVGISIATPGVITVGNNCAAGQAVVFATSSALPTGL